MEEGYTGKEVVLHHVLHGVNLFEHPEESYLNVHGLDFSEQLGAAVRDTARLVCLRRAHHGRIPEPIVSYILGFLRRR